MEFENKVVLITGACSGLGKAIAQHLKNKGALLAMTGLSKESSISGLWISSDLSKDDQVEMVYSKTMKRYGKIDVLINCAGVLEHNSVMESSPEQLRRVMDINVKAAYQLTTLAAPILAANSGCIINMSSVTGLRAFPNVAAYCISKAALDHLTRVSALELAPLGVRVNSVNPGVIKTPIYGRSGLDGIQVKEFLENSKNTHAMGRIGQASEVAELVAFLASSKASFITGVCIPIDGGRHLMCPR